MPENMQPPMYSDSMHPTHKLRMGDLNLAAEEVEQEEENEDEKEDKFVKDVEDAISQNEEIERKLAHGILVGPPGSGKSSLMDRLLGKSGVWSTSSTGVCDSVVIVHLEDNPSTFHSVCVDRDTWNEVGCAESLLRQVDEKIKCSPQNSQPPVQLSPNVADSPVTSTTVDTLSAINSDNVSSTDPQPLTVATMTATTTSDSRPCINLKKIINKTIKNCGGFKNFKHLLKRTISMYLRDAGGQVEFQEMLPLLVYGPSIFLFVFRLDLDFKSKFEIEYRISADKTLNSYTSSISTEEAFLQFLASVYAIEVSNRVGVETHKPLVFIIGTHKDKLDSKADKRIADLNDHLDSLVKNGGFDELVQYANRKKNQVLFAVSNTSESDEDFKNIRSRVHCLINDRPEFTIKYPVSYLLFCIELQHMQRSVLKLDECKNIAAKYGITDKQVPHLLHFLHLRLGVIRYFDKDGVKHLVINEPKLLFNKVTKLVISTFIDDYESLTTKEACNFEKKGILTASTLKSSIGVEDNITAAEFLKLLTHLRLATPFTAPGSQTQEESYFFPSVLNHVPESNEAEMATDIAPLCVKFACEHCPKGLFGVLITHLMNPDGDSKSTVATTLTLIQEKIFKDQVSFEVHSSGVTDEIILRAYASHLEINFYPENSEERDTPVNQACNNVRKLLVSSIQRALQDLHYSSDSVKPVVCLRCNSCASLHEVTECKNFKTYCKKMRATNKIPHQAECWFINKKGSDIDVTASSTASESYLTVNDHSKVTKLLDDQLSQPELKKLGLKLGLHYHHLKNMNQESLLHEVISSWLRKDDQVEAVGMIPSWENLAKALEESSFTGIAQKVRDQYLTK